MTITDAAAVLAANVIWQAEAVLVNNQTPFKLASGNSSPIYVDLGKCLGHRLASHTLTSLLQTVCDNLSLALPMTQIAGIEVRGALYAKLLADALNADFIGIRKQAKGHGVGNKYFGSTPRGTGVHALLVDDTTTDGASKVAGIDALRLDGAIVTNCLTIVDRGQGAAETLKELDVDLVSLVDLPLLLEVGFDLNHMTSEEHSSVMAYLADTPKWHSDRQLTFKG